jgi:ubiquinone/menaquinone biosynthesis C-methylase UbiE
MNKLFYDSIAADFDKIMDRYDLRRRIETVFDQFLANVNLQDLLLLDAGCGTGFFSAQALKRGAKVFSLDIGINLLKETRKKGLSLLVAADVEKMPFASNTFDIVISSECIEHTTSPQAAVKDMIRILRPGGTIIITCPNHFWYWSRALGNALKIRPYKQYLRQIR